MTIIFSCCPYRAVDDLLLVCEMKRQNKPLDDVMIYIRMCLGRAWAELTACCASTILQFPFAPFCSEKAALAAVNCEFWRYVVRRVPTARSNQVNSAFDQRGATYPTTVTELLLRGYQQTWAGVYYGIFLYTRSPRIQNSFVQEHARARWVESDVL